MTRKGPQESDERTVKEGKGPPLPARPIPDGPTAPEGLRSWKPQRPRELPGSGASRS
jgi:hypothetical protein